MKIEQKSIAGIPAIRIGARSDTAYLFVHGKMGSKDEAAGFARFACPAGCQVVGIDLPEHGSRKEEREKLVPWVAVPEIKAVYTAMKESWHHIGLRANSIGAWFSTTYQGSRMMAEALAKVTESCFEHTELQRLWADVHILNTASYKTLEKVGFKREGHVRGGKMVSTYCDYYLYGMTKADWLKKGTVSC